MLADIASKYVSEIHFIARVKYRVLRSALDLLLCAGVSFPENKKPAELTVFVLSIEG